MSYSIRLDLGCCLKMSRIFSDDTSVMFAVITIDDTLVGPGIQTLIVNPPVAVPKYVVKQAAMELRKTRPFPNGDYFLAKESPQDTNVAIESLEQISFNHSKIPELIIELHRDSHYLDVS